MNQDSILKLQVSHKGSPLSFIDIKIFFRHHAFVPVLFGSIGGLGCPGEKLKILFSVGPDYSPNRHKMAVKLTKATGASYPCVVTDDAVELLTQAQEFNTFEFTLNGGMSNPTIRATVYAFRCLIFETTPQGTYNLSVVNTQFGSMPLSEYAFVQLSVNDNEQQKYMVKVVRRVYNLGQSKISYLGGYLQPQGYNITLDGNPDISFEGRTCVVTTQPNADQLLCYLHSLNVPIPRKFYAGNAGVTHAKKDCLAFEYELLKRTYQDLDPADYRVSLEPSFSDMTFYTVNTCIRKQAIIRVPFSMQFAFGPVCSPAFCSLRMSEDGLEKQASVMSVKTIETVSIYSYQTLLSSFDAYLTTTKNFYSENDYLLDVVQFAMRRLL